MAPLACKDNVCAKFCEEIMTTFCAVHCKLGYIVRLFADH